MNGRCPRCLKTRPGNPDERFGLSFAPSCPHCDYGLIPEHPITLIVWVCPYCMKQYPGPHGHHVAGDDHATGCFHANPGERGIAQPKLIKIEVEPVQPFESREIPHDVEPKAAA